MKLYERAAVAQVRLPRVEPKYCIAYEPPGSEGQVSVLVPAPEWLAMALAGGYLPPVEAYLGLRCLWRKGPEFMTTDHLTRPGEGWHGGHILNMDALHAAPTIGPMSEEQAMEYLLQKDVPRAVWQDFEKANRKRFAIFKRDALPPRAFRDAWKLNDFAEAAA